MSEAPKRYRVVLKPLPAGWWFAEVPGVQGCSAQGPTLSAIKARILKALATLGAAEGGLDFVIADE